jgi:glutaconyl-CoA/methylmalonyl-CoA decarboxylase subunit gamma
MKYRVSIEGRDREVDVVITPSGGVTATLDGRPIALDARLVPGGVSLRLGDRVFDVLSSGTEDLQVASGRARGAGAIANERTAKKRAGAAGSAGKELRAPMPGRVVRILAKKGDQVVAGQPLLVIEAMKMENELRASGPATIGEIHVAEGASVEGRAVLVTFA